MKFLNVYEQGAAFPEEVMVVYDLSQNPSKRPVKTGRSGQLPTVRRGSILWCAEAQRWMTRKEVACVMGIPVTPELLAAARIRSDAIGDYSRSQLGNAMHVPCVGMVTMLALACSQPRQG